jgi:hypothetical protein
MAVMKLDPQSSRTLGMTRKPGHSVPVGSGAARRSKPGRLRLTLRIGRTARIRLRSARTAKLTLFVRASHAKRTERYTRLIRLSR